MNKYYDSNVVNYSWNKCNKKIPFYYKYLKENSFNFFMTNQKLVEQLKETFIHLVVISDKYTKKMKLVFASYIKIFLFKLY